MSAKILSSPSKFNLSCKRHSCDTSPWRHPHQMQFVSFLALDFSPFFRRNWNPGMKLTKTDQRIPLRLVFFFSFPLILLNFPRQIARDGRNPSRFHFVKGGCHWGTTSREGIRLQALKLSNPPIKSAVISLDLSWFNSGVRWWTSGFIARCQLMGREHAPT